MPTNLPPEFFQIDKRYRAAETTEEKIELLEELLGTIPKHKGTEHLRADYKTRLAKLRQAAQGGKSSKSRHASTFHIPREGAGQVVLIGGTNTGKSALLQALTNAEPEVGPTPFTTWEPLPGMLDIQGVHVQLVDTPALDRPVVEPELFELMRRADLLLLVIDLSSDPFAQLEGALAQLQQHRILPVAQKNAPPPPEEEGPRRWLLPLVILANKCDDPTNDQDCRAFCELTGAQWPVIPVSAERGRNLEQIQQLILDRLDVIRVYAKPPGREPDLNAPFVLRAGSTLEELGGRIHKDFLNNLKFARVWGKAVHDGQMVARDYVLHDGDIVELHV